MHAARDAQGHERGDLALAAVPQGMVMPTRLAAALPCF